MKLVSHSFIVNHTNVPRCIVRVVDFFWHTARLTDLYLVSVNCISFLPLALLDESTREILNSVCYLCHVGGQRSELNEN